MKRSKGTAILVMFLSMLFTLGLINSVLSKEIPKPGLKPSKGSLPDLVIREIKCGPGNKLQFTAANIGTGSLPSGWRAVADVFFDGRRMGHVDLGRPTSGDITPAGGTATYLVAFDILSLYNVKIVVDSTGSVSESNEGNNTMTARIDPCQPDLSIFDWFYEGSAARYLTTVSARQGETKSVTMSVLNALKDVTGDFSVGIYLSNVPPTSCVPTSIRLWQTTVTGGIPARSSRSLSATITIPTTLTPGNYWMFCMADDTNRIVEANERNNCTNHFQLTITAR
jgi:subtilase family serine protease